MAAIVLDRVRKVFSGGQTAVADLDVRIANGERLVLVGPSGSGKSTVLRLIAGLEAPTSGRIFVDAREVTDIPPEQRDLAMVFQSYALYPHKTVRENLAFGLRMHRVARAEIDGRVSATADALGIADLLDRIPAQLSGGQRQRVALGRAIVRQPQAFLFDEPLSNLDPRLRGETRAEVVALHRRLGTTMVYVTHDQEEAMTVGQRIAVLRDGRLEQLATPLELYERPANTFVARFIGSPPMNLLKGRVTRESGTVRIETCGQIITIDAVESQILFEAVRAVGIRPHVVSMTDPQHADLRGRLDVIEPLGHAQIAHVTLDADVRVVVVVRTETPLSVDSRVGLAFARNRLLFFDDAGRRLD